MFRVIILTFPYSYLLLGSSLMLGELDPYEYQVKANDWLHRFHENELINWNWPSVTVHVVAEHGGDIIKALPATPGHFKLFILVHLDHSV